MVVEVLAANAIAMRICIIAPAKNACIGNIVRKEITEPVFAVRSYPSRISVPVQAMDSDDTGNRQDRLPRQEG